MSARWFICPDHEQIEIKDCLIKCRMDSRCATKPFLRLVGFDREWQGVSPSSAGTGPRQLFLKATVPYSVDPNSRVFAAFGTSTHERLALKNITSNVLAEEKLSDGEIKGTADLLEDDEMEPGKYILTDHKTFGSFKVAKCLGIVSETVEETILDGEGRPILLKTGPNKGQPKTRQQKKITQDPAKVDLRSETLQLNRYRTLLESAGFPISRMQLQVVCRDGGTYIAKNRGIDRNLYLIPIKRMINKDVLDFYRNLAQEVQDAFANHYIRKCNNWETWEGKRCESFCEVLEECKAMSHKAGERWGIL